MKIQVKLTNNLASITSCYWSLSQSDSHIFSIIHVMYTVCHIYVCIIMYVCVVHITCIVCISVYHTQTHVPHTLHRDLDFFIKILYIYLLLVYIYIIYYYCTASVLTCMHTCVHTLITCEASCGITCTLS